MSDRRWLLPVVWAAVILALTSYPNPDLSALKPVVFEGADQVVHATLYGVLGGLCARAWLPPRVGADSMRTRRVVLAIILGIMAFGAADEWHQQFIPGRSMDVLDWLADTAGAMCGVAVGLAALRRERLT